MAGRLAGKRIAIIATDGVEQAELTEPRKAVTDEGAVADLISVSGGSIQAMNGDIHPADTFEVDKLASAVQAQDYDALLLPGGTVSADRLRMDEDVVAFVRQIVATGKPVGVICHGPWALVEADVVRGRTLTSYPSIRTDITNAGGTVVDEEVVIDQGIVSSRNPDDLPAFCATIVEEFAKGQDAGAIG
ncbi:MAG TPA: type 1 glutamine amidotransferase domain-containing protein [Pseudonocardia sp.]|jgi:protease I|uniref:type 1 glutamine amidotransferase domain-containing protein n=1 Tax=Pseudonocardia sp. TaxID=60912 RepID=UPI002F40F42F